MRFIVLLIGLFSMPLQAELAYWSNNKTESEYTIDVYRSATCGCCKAWLDHLKQHNFKINDHVEENMSLIKQKLGIPQQAASCHTAVVAGKLIEGHVPAQDIKRVINDKSIRLLAVPGMVSGSPGMDSPGNPNHDFKVYAIDGNGKVSVYSEYKDY